MISFQLIKKFALILGCFTFNISKGNYLFKAFELVEFMAFMEFCIPGPALPLTSFVFDPL